jgi:hypothetical protein
MPFDLAVTLLEHAEWLSGQGRATETAAPLAEAVDIFERLRARPWLDRAAALTASSPMSVSASPADLAGG